ncbi:metaxin-2-like isoform X1 [Clavelina lepadiformis]|uniref:Metaxin-2 n=1 Tax=Clavelina lepadiformis TaxID=159417 RepID=A0ABP0G7B4_CLALP
MSNLSFMQDAFMCQMAAAEPWPEDASLFRPPEGGQILIGENALSLGVEVYLRMCECSFKVVTCTNAEFMAPSGKLPVLLCGKFVISEPTPVINFMKQKGISLSKDLPESEQRDLKAYIEMINNILIPAELFVTWAHEETLTQITSVRYGSPYPWPLNKILCWRKKQEMLTYLEAVGWGKDQRSLATVQEELKRCCQALAQKLANKKFFFGQKPTELDALVFGHLYTLLTTKLPDNRMAETVQSFQNLVSFCKNIEKQYFGHKT